MSDTFEAFVPEAARQITPEMVGQTVPLTVDGQAVGTCTILDVAGHVSIQPDRAWTPSFASGDAFSIGSFKIEGSES